MRWRCTHRLREWEVKMRMGEEKKDEMDGERKKKMEERWGSGGGRKMTGREDL